MVPQGTVSLNYDAVSRENADSRSEIQSSEKIASGPEA